MNNNEIASPSEVIEKVHKAADLLKNKGKEGLEILRDPKSEFTWKDTYIFIIDRHEKLDVQYGSFGRVEDAEASMKKRTNAVSP